jgi:peptidoglycan/xylan/chitin deacetylase (PgdA/CDA1 family)
MLAVMRTIKINLVGPREAARRGASVALLGGLLAGTGSFAYAAESATVFMYHRFDEQAHPTTNILVGQFEAHIAELTNGKHNPLGLPEIVNTLRRGKQLPKNAVGISIDDAFKSVYTVAWPRLKAAGLPFTLFVATQPIDQNAPGYMTWDQIRELVREGVTIGSQTASHLHMAGSSMAAVIADIEKSNARFVEELGKKPEFFAYPYGESSAEVRAYVIKAGFKASFGQHSGVIHSDSDFHYLPRFAMNETYGDLIRVRRAANALPLRVREITPADPKLTPAGNPPSYGFTVFGDALKNIRSLNCYAWGQGKTRVERLGSGRIEIRLAKKFPPGRARVNCTMPAGGGKWRWFGMQFYIPKS